MCTVAGEHGVHLDQRLSRTSARPATVRYAGRPRGAKAEAAPSSLRSSHGAEAIYVIAISPGCSRLRVTSTGAPRRSRDRPRSGQGAAVPPLPTAVQSYAWAAARRANERKRRKPSVPTAPSIRHILQRQSGGGLRPGVAGGAPVAVPPADASSRQPGEAASRSRASAGRRRSAGGLSSSAHQPVAG